MNERIRKLAEQAYKEVIETNDYNGSAYTVREFDQEKFVELIVRECEKAVAVEIETNNKPNIDRGWDDHEQGYVTGMRAATKVIREHFGVPWHGCVGTI